MLKGQDRRRWGHRLSRKHNLKWGVEALSGINTAQGEASLYKLFSHRKVSNNDGNTWTMCGELAFYKFIFFKKKNLLEGMLCITCCRYNTEPNLRDAAGIRSRCIPRLVFILILLCSTDNALEQKQLDKRLGFHICMDARRAYSATCQCVHLLMYNDRTGKTV